MRWSVLAVVLSAFGLLAAGCGGAKTQEYRVPSSSMEPTLHCALPTPGCHGTTADRVVAQVGKPVKRGDIVVFSAPIQAVRACGAGGTFIKRIVGLPGEWVSEDPLGFISINGKRLAEPGKRLAEPYVSAKARSLDTRYGNTSWKVPAGDYFVLGDNRSQACDSRMWDGLPRGNIIGPVVKIIRGS